MAKPQALSLKFIGSSLLVFLLMVTGTPAWADECSDARRALEIAEAGLARVEAIYRKAEAKYEKAKKKADDLLDEWTKAYEVEKKAAKVRELRQMGFYRARDRLRLNPGSETFNTKFKTEVWKKVQVAKAAYDKALAAEKAASKIADKISEKVEKAEEEQDKARPAMTSAYKTFENQKNKVADAKRAVEDACKGKVGLEGLLESFGMNDGPGVVKEYTGRANEANTEDIAIEEARRRGFDDDDDDGGGTTLGGGGTLGGGVAMTNATFSAQCDINTGTGTNTLSANGSAFCTVNGGAPSLGGGTANITCAPGSTVAISATCSATNCRAFVNSFTNLTCPFTAPGFITGGFGGAGGFGTNASINCMCQ